MVGGGARLVAVVAFVLVPLPLASAGPIDWAADTVLETADEAGDPVWDAMPPEFWAAYDQYARPWADTAQPEVDEVGWYLYLADRTVSDPESVFSVLDWALGATEDPVATFWGYHDHAAARTFDGYAIQAMDAASDAQAELGTVDDTVDDAPAALDLYDRSWTTASIGVGSVCAVRLGDVECDGPTAVADPFPAKAAVAVSVRGDRGSMLSPEHDTMCVLYDDGNAGCQDSHEGSSAYTGGDAVDVVALPWGGHCVLRSNGNVACGSFAYTGGDAVQMDVGHEGVCVVTTGGNVVCSGGFTDTAGTAVQVAQGPNHLCILRTAGTFDCVGDNEWGEAVDSTRTDTVALQAFDGSTCALTAAGNTWCQGGFTCTPEGDGEVCEASTPEAYDGGDAAAHFAGPLAQCWRFTDDSFHCETDNVSYFRPLDSTGKRLKPVEAPTVP